MCALGIAETLLLMKACIACAEEIQYEAKLCRFCNTSQNDEDFFPRIQPVVAPTEAQPLRASAGTKAAGGPKNEIASSPLAPGLALQTPGKVTAIVLASVGVLTFAFPILCLPTSVTAAVMATRGIRWERKNGILSSTTLQIVRVAAILAASTTTLLMVLAIPGAYDANFG